MKNPVSLIRRKVRRMIFGDPHAYRLMKTNLEVFAQAGVQPVAYKILPSQENHTSTDVILRKEPGGIVALVRVDYGWQSCFETHNKIAPYVYWFERTSDDVREIIVNASDGNWPSAAEYRFTSTSDRHVLLPDPHFFRDRGYVETDAFAADNTMSWHDRSDTIVWRGGLNGTGHWSVDPDIITLPGIMHRLHMAHECQAVGVDFRFVSYPHVHNYLSLKQAGFIGEFIPTHDWGYMKYAIDIDGYTNAWCNFLQRLKLGCCVLKVNSPFKYRQWYYDRIQPWEHFVPIKSDLSDLKQQVEWVRTNSEKVREIAINGQNFARALTFESENSYAINAIEKHALST